MLYGLILLDKRDIMAQLSERRYLLTVNHYEDKQIIPQATQGHKKW